eukprot:346827-Rhodomonas_salina.2
MECTLCGCGRAKTNTGTSTAAARTVEPLKSTVTGSETEDSTALGEDWWVLSATRRESVRGSGGESTLVPSGWL